VDREDWVFGRSVCHPCLVQPKHDEEHDAGSQRANNHSAAPLVRHSSFLQRKYQRNRPGDGEDTSMTVETPYSFEIGFAVVQSRKGNKQEDDCYGNNWATTRLARDDFE
jgi:hypothetical protein